MDEATATVAARMGSERRNESKSIIEVFLLIECRTMASPERLDAIALMKRFRPDETALGEALSLFVDRPDYGLVRLAYDDGIPF
jgi:hypothetical protein